VYLNAVGGVKLDEPAVDLGIAVAIASSFTDKPIDPGSVVIGEVGLSGEIRSVTHLERRIREAAKLGFTKFIVPRNNMKKFHYDDEIRGLKIQGVESVAIALKIMLSAS
jgi:DNA repair protein RadA/Sms